MAEIDPRPFQAQLLLAEGQQERDRALLENARRDLERYQVLASQDSIARQQYETQRSLVHQYEGVVLSDQAQIDTAKLQITYARISSPFTGRVGLRLVDPGNIVHTSDTGGIVTLTQVVPISVVFTLSEDSLPQVRDKLRAGEQLPTEAFDRDFTRKIASGTLLTVDNQIDPATGTVKLKAIFSNEDDQLFPNQFVNARLLVDIRRGATLVPVSAVQRSPGRALVYVVSGAEQSVTLRTVTVGPSEGDDVVIETGLAPGEQVVVAGGDKVHEGSAVTPHRENDGGTDAETP